jgi:hypothetical protein
MEWGFTCGLYQSQELWEFQHLVGLFKDLWNRVCASGLVEIDQELIFHLPAKFPCGGIKIPQIEGGPLQSPGYFPYRLETLQESCNRPGL